MEAGKRHHRSASDNKEMTEIEVVFKHDPSLCLLWRRRRTGHYQQFHRFPSGSARRYHYPFLGKEAGFQMEIEERVSNSIFGAEHKSQYTEEYEKLLARLHGRRPDAFHFKRRDRRDVAFCRPDRKGMGEGLVPLRHYAPDSPAVIAEAQVVDRARQARRNI